MKIYSDNQDYQALVAVLEETQTAFDTAKTEKKEVRAAFKTTKKDAKSKARVFATYLQYRQAKLKQKVEKLTVRGAELNLLAFVHDFKETYKQQAAEAKKLEKSQKAQAKKEAENQADAVETPVSKTGKVKKTVKAEKTKKVVEETVVESANQPKVAKKTTKKTDEKPQKATKKTDAKFVFETNDSVQEEAVAVNTSSTNDLTIIEGIGPKIARILAENGVNNFKELIAASIGDIKTWLKAHKLPFVNPTSWAEQAQLADEGKTEAFEALKQALKNGKRQQA